MRNLGRIISRIRRSGSDMVVFLFCVFASGGFWVLQKLDDTFETEIRVPLELTGVPDGVIVTTSLPQYVTVTIHDRGTNLMHYMRSGEIRQPISLDYSVYDNGGRSGVAHIPLSDVQRILQQRLLTSTHIQRIRPDTLQFCYNHGISRMLPVKFVGNITTSSQNYLQYVSFQRDSVKVFAPEAVLDTMRYAYIRPVRMSNLDKTTSCTVRFRPVNGVKYSPSTLGMTAHVDYFTEQSAVVPVTGTNFPAGITLKTFPSEVRLTYRIGAANVEHVNASSFVIAVTYEELLRCSGGKYEVHVRSVPIGVSNIRIEPKSVDFLLEETTVTE